MISIKKISSLLLISQKEGIIIGKLEDCLFNRETRVVEGWLLKKGGIFSSLGGINASSIVLCGKDVVLIDSIDSIKWDTKRVSHKKSTWSSLYQGKKLIHRDGKSFACVEDLHLSSDVKMVIGLQIEDDRVIKLNEYISLSSDGGILPRKYEMISIASESSDGFWSKFWDFIGGDDDSET